MSDQDDLPELDEKGSQVQKIIDQVALWPNDGSVYLIDWLLDPQISPLAEILNELENKKAAFQTLDIFGGIVAQLNEHFPGIAELEKQEILQNPTLGQAFIDWFETYAIPHKDRVINDIDLLFQSGKPIDHLYIKGLFAENTVLGDSYRAAPDSQKLRAWKNNRNTLIRELASVLFKSDFGQEVGKLLVFPPL